MKNPWQASLTSRDRQGLDVESCHALEAFDILEARSGAGCSCVLYHIVSFVSTTSVLSQRDSGGHGKAVLKKLPKVF